MGRTPSLAAIMMACHWASASHLDSRGKYLLGYNVDAFEVCYTYITVVPATSTPAPDPGYVTTTVGNPDITGPVTLTVPPTGTVPGTVIIQTPIPGSPSTVTLTTGNPTITAPVTQTIPASGTVPGTVIIETPIPGDPSMVTITTGNPTITAPVTQTIPASGTVPGTVIVETPIPGSPLIVTFTTGNPTITGPVTFTVPASGTVPGTVIVETPEPPSPAIMTITTGNPTITGTLTRTVPGVGTVPGTVIVETPDPAPTPTPTPTPSPTTTAPAESSTPPAFECDAGGYLIQGRELYRLDLTTGENVLINDAVGPGGSINAIGYNVNDNYIWGIIPIDGVTELIRIDSAGEGTVWPLGLSTGWFSGDVDDSNRLWLHTTGGGWAVVDIDESSPTFATVLAQGTDVMPAGYTAADWAFVPGGGDYLYSILYSDGESARARWSTITRTWELLEEYGVVTAAATNDNWGAMYSAGNGYLYASENSSGEIWRFPILAGGDPELVTQGPVSSSNDGARCVNAPDPPIID